MWWLQIAAAGARAAAAPHGDVCVTWRADGWRSTVVEHCFCVCMLTHRTSLKYWGPAHSTFT